MNSRTPESGFPYMERHFRDRLYVWTEALSGMVSRPAQELPYKVWTYRPIYSKEIQDSLGFWILHRGFRIPSTWLWILYQWNLNSGFQSLVGFRIPWRVFGIPKPRISDSTTQFPGFQIHKNFPDSGIRIPLHGAKTMTSKKKTSPRTWIVPKNWNTKRRHLTFSSRTYITKIIMPKADKMVRTVNPIRACLRGQLNVTIHGESSTHVSHPGWHFRHLKESGFEWYDVLLLAAWASISDPLKYLSLSVTLGKKYPGLHTHL